MDPRGLSCQMLMETLPSHNTALCPEQRLMAVMTAGSVLGECDQGCSRLPAGFPKEQPALLRGRPKW